MPDYHFRKAVEADRPAITRIVDAAFRPEDVVTFLNALREDDCIIGEWVAETGGGIVAHIVFSRVFVETPDGGRTKAAMLTPLAVHPDRQNRGIGTALMDHAIRALEAAGEDLFVVLGHPDYYPRAGFSAEAAGDLKNPWQGNPAFMARGAVPSGGTLIMPPSIANAH
ncbi:MAG: N-acetyltransferase [Alphaproteobacteria bacterium]